MAPGVGTGGRELPENDDAGLLAGMADLDGPGFDASRLHPLVREFYEHTTRFRMEVWMQWNPLAWPATEVVRRGFGRRVDQLGLPSRPLDVAYGLGSRVTLLAGPDGSLVLTSEHGAFGEGGCYMVVRDGGRDHCSRAPLHERFSIHVDDEGVLRTDHQLRLWSIPGVQLHYKLVRAAAEG